MEFLLRWLQVKGQGHEHACLQDTTPLNPHSTAPNDQAIDTLSNGCFADDLLCLAHTLRNLEIEADKTTRYSDWAALLSIKKLNKSDGLIKRRRQASMVQTQAPNSKPSLKTESKSKGSVPITSEPQTFSCEKMTENLTLK